MVDIVTIRDVTWHHESVILDMYTTAASGTLFEQLLRPQSSSLQVFRMIAHYESTPVHIQPFRLYYAVFEAHQLASCAEPAGIALYGVRSDTIDPII